MHKHITAISLLLAEIIITTMIMTATIGISSINSDQLAYVHNFVPSTSSYPKTLINSTFYNMII